MPTITQGCEPHSGRGMGMLDSIRSWFTRDQMAIEASCKMHTQILCCVYSLWLFFPAALLSSPRRTTPRGGYCSAASCDYAVNGTGYGPRGYEPMHFYRPKMSWSLPCINSIKRTATPGEVSCRIHFSQIDLLIDFISALCPQFCGFSVVIVRGEWVLPKDTGYLFTVFAKLLDLIAFNVLIIYPPLEVGCNSYYDLYLYVLLL